MKFFVIICFLIRHILLSETNTNINTKSKLDTTFEAHMETLNLMRLKSQLFLDRLYKTANSFSNWNAKAQYQENVHELNSLLLTKRTKRDINNSNKNPKSELNTEVHKEFPKYYYRDYRDVIATMHQLAKDYPELIKLSTGQKDYNLPNPGGRCKEER